MKIVKIERSKHKRQRVLLYTEKGDLLRITEAELLSFDLYVGKELSEEQIASLHAAARRSELASRAAQLASGRMLSRRELRQKLQRKGASPEEAANLAERMAALGAVNDAAYAGVIVRHYAAMGYGKGRVEQELYRRGIDKALWDGALAELPESGEAVEQFLKNKLKGRTPDRVERKKLADALLRRGFSWNEIRPALNKLGEEVFEEE